MSNDYKIEGRPATIFRTVKSKDNPYVMIDRRPIDNPALSFKAKGILTYLMSRPDGWEVSVTDLVRHSREGEGSIRSGLKELREAGHMEYSTSRDDKKRITGWLIKVYEVPLSTPQNLDCDFQDVENLQVGNQDVENRTQVLSTLSTTERIKKDIYIDPVVKKIDELKFPLNPNTPTLLAIWREDFTDEVIIRALEMAKGKSINYSDKILIGWKANGVPLTRDEQVKNAKSAPRPARQSQSDLEQGLAAWVASQQGAD